MASLLSTKQISSLLKVKRLQFVENAVGLGSRTVAPPAGSPAGTPSTKVARSPVVLVFNIKSLPSRAMLAARKQFHDVDLKLRKVPNGVVKSCSRNTPFQQMMTGPTLIATPVPGKEFNLQQIVEVARGLTANDKINKGLLFTGLVHHNVYMTPQRLAEVDFEAPKQLPALVAQGPVRILQLVNQARIPTLAVLQANIQQKAKQGDMAAAQYVAQQQQ